MNSSIKKNIYTYMFTYITWPTWLQIVFKELSAINQLIQTLCELGSHEVVSVPKSP